MNSKKILIAGLPGTGKTTFIAALWHFVQPSPHNKVFSLESLSKGEHEYLNYICNEWLVYKRAVRTPQPNPAGESAIMKLKNLKNEEIICLEIPDFQGETFKLQYEDREWYNEYSEMLNEISGILLFVSAEDKNNRPQLIVHANEAAALMGAEALTSNEGLETATWKMGLSPNQVKLVDILQFISYYKPQITPVKITLLISAWDVLEEKSQPKILPEKWIENNLPLLYQFLISNQDLFKTRFLGISAQGCDYEDPEEVEKLLSKNPSDRINIKDGDIYNNDITEIIDWLANDD